MQAACKAVALGQQGVQVPPDTLDRQAPKSSLAQQAARLILDQQIPVQFRGEPLKTEEACNLRKDRLFSGKRVELQRQYVADR